MRANQENPTLKRLEEQIDWYDKKSAFNQSCFKRLKIIELIAAALIPLWQVFQHSIATAKPRVLKGDEKGGAKVKGYCRGRKSFDFCRTSILTIAEIIVFDLSKRHRTFEKEKYRATMLRKALGHGLRDT